MLIKATNRTNILFLSSPYFLLYSYSLNSRSIIIRNILYYFFLHLYYSAIFSDISTNKFVTVFKYLKFGKEKKKLVTPMFFSFLFFWNNIKVLIFMPKPKITSKERREFCCRHKHTKTPLCVLKPFSTLFLLFPA